MDSTLKEIIDQLISKTAEKKVIWQKSSSANEFFVVFSSGTLSTRLYSIKNPLGFGNVQCVECVVTNNRGDVVLRGSKQVGEEGDNELSELYDAAFRSYTGKDEVLKDIVSQLEGSEIIGK